MKTILYEVFLILAFLSFSTQPSAQTLGPLITVSPADFLKLPDRFQSLYVGGVIDGMTFTSYGYTLPDHDVFVRCLMTIKVGDLSERVVAWLHAHPSFNYGTASAVAQTIGSYCKEKGLR